MSNAATVQCIPAARRTGQATFAKLFDLSGNHWQQHGSTVYCNADKTPTPVAVCSRYGLASRGKAQVFVQSDTGPFVMAMQLSPAAAREHAQALMDAADRADEVQAIVKATV